VLLWWRGPDWNAVPDAFQAVHWYWVAVAVGFNLLSIVLRVVAWQIVIAQAMPPPRPRFPLVFSAFCVGLLANAVLPGRIGELARVGVLTRKTPAPQNGTWATLVGTIFAHRVFDIVPSLLLIVYVLVTAKIPDWALTSLIAVVVVGSFLFLLAFLTARRHHRSVLEEAGTLKRLITMARFGLGIMHEPVPAAGAILFQCAGWLCQFFAVYTAMVAFHIHEPLPAAGLVLATAACVAGPDPAKIRRLPDTTGMKNEIIMKHGTPKRPATLTAKLRRPASIRIDAARSPRCSS